MHQHRTLMECAHPLQAVRPGKRQRTSIRAAPALPQSQNKKRRRRCSPGQQSSHAGRALLAEKVLLALQVLLAGGLLLAGTELLAGEVPLAARKCLHQTRLPAWVLRSPACGRRGERTTQRQCRRRSHRLPQHGRRALRAARRLTSSSLLSGAAPSSRCLVAPWRGQAVEQCTLTHSNTCCPAFSSKSAVCSLQRCTLQGERSQRAAGAACPARRAQLQRGARVLNSPSNRSANPDSLPDTCATCADHMHLGCEVRHCLPDTLAAFAITCAFAREPGKCLFMVGPTAGVLYLDTDNLRTRLKNGDTGSYFMCLCRLVS